MLTIQRIQLKRAARYFVCLTCLTGLFLVQACQDDEEHLAPEPYQVLASIEKTEKIVFDDAVAALLEENNINDEQLAPYRQIKNMTALRSRVYKAHVITYHTTDPNGHPVVASGVVYYPQSGTPKGVIEAIALDKSRNMCASRHLANTELLEGMAGYVILVADRIGRGATESMVLPNFYFDNVAQVCADLRRAATELVRNVYGRSMPSWTMITGLSLSAPGAWTLARYYHQHPELSVNVSELWMMGGVYRPMLTFQYQLSRRQVDYAFIPNALYSVNHYDSLGLDLGQVFRGELAMHYEEWCTGNVSMIELTDLLGSDISQYLNLDFFNESNDDYRRLCASVERMAVATDWVPDCKVRVYHGRDDTIVPIACSDEIVSYLQSVGADVDYVITETDHTDCAIAMAADMVKFLYW